VQAGSVAVDVCLGGCGGIWFDIFELQKLDDPNEAGGEMLVNVKKQDHLQIDYSQRRNCPRCLNIVMMRHFYSPRRRVEVDECPNCGGFWLDAGELALIREEHQHKEQQQAAVEQYLDVMAAAILPPMRTSGPEHAIRARRIDQLFRFSVPIRFQRE
jgi:Zn-finger nucleic acid-binding protein